MRKYIENNLPSGGKDFVTDFEPNGKRRDLPWEPNRSDAFEASVHQAKDECNLYRLLNDRSASPIEKYNAALALLMMGKDISLNRLEELRREANL